jgi:hypothetical protein
MMKPLRIISVFLLSAFACTTAFAQANAVDATHCVPVRSVAAKDLAFKSGERLTYVVRYDWGPIHLEVGSGRVSLDSTVLNGRKVFHGRIYGKSYKFYDIFFKVREGFDSWFTMDGLRPLKFIRDTHEGNYVAQDLYVYDWSPDNKHINANLSNTKHGQKSVSLSLTECTYDIPALFFMARNLDLTKVRQNVRYPMTFAIDDDVYNVFLVFQGSENRYVNGLGTVRTLKFGAGAIAGNVFTGKDMISLWISDDENRIPVYFEAPILKGVASGRLSSYSGLKHGFSSLIK